jgi:hypothetical protein
MIGKDFVSLKEKLDFSQRFFNKRISLKADDIVKVYKQAHRLVSIELGKTKADFSENFMDKLIADKIKKILGEKDGEVYL